MNDSDASYRRLGAHFFSENTPTKCLKPEVLLYNQDLAEDLGLANLFSDKDQGSQIFSGNKPLGDFAPLSLAYAGHQFGHFVPLLGDGRAHLIAQIKGFDLQLKGSGRSQFSRRGDGKSALGPVIREFIISEAMHKLGVPTTRSLAAVATGETVQREEIRAGGVLTRVAKSHLRIGTFEYISSRGLKDELKKLADFTIKKCYPHLQGQEEKYLEFFKEASQSYLKLIARWMGLGFIHGVMNTDNSSLSGETLDYGPCAFMDDFSSQRVFSSIDQHGRYRYSQQPSIGLWNLTSLAHCLIPLIHEDDQTAVKILQSELETLASFYETESMKVMGAKLGIESAGTEDKKLIQQWFDYLEKHHLDFTLSHLALKDLLDSQKAHSFFVDDEDFQTFRNEWTQRLKLQETNRSVELMNRSNPIYIPRNHLIERAIQNTYQGDLRFARELIEVLKHPFTEQEGREEFRQGPGPLQQGYRTFCGT